VGRRGVCAGPTVGIKKTRATLRLHGPREDPARERDLETDDILLEVKTLINARDKHQANEKKKGGVQEGPDTTASKTYYSMG